MPRPDKVQAVADIKERLEGASAVFLAEYSGLSVKEQQELRRNLRAQGAEFKVVKMTLTRLAAAELELDEIDDWLSGPTGLTFTAGDPAPAAKVLDDFAGAHEVFTIKGGLLGRDLLTPERVEQLAKLEPRDVLLAKLAGAFQAPMANLAGLLAALPRGAATMMAQLLEQKESEAPAETDDAAAAPEAEAPADEAEPQAEAEAAAESEVAEAESQDAAPEEADAADDAAADEADAEEADDEAAAEASAEATSEDSAAADPDEDAAEADPDSGDADSEDTDPDAADSEATDSDATDSDATDSDD